MSEPTVRGGCLCGCVRFSVARAELRGVIVCHCSLCRRWGTLAGAYTGARRDALRVEHDGSLATYADVNGRERSFCRRCGSSLLWAEGGSDEVSISAGALDGDAGLETLRHIYVESAAGWEEIPGAHPRHPGGSSTAPRE